MSEVQQEAVVVDESAASEAGTIDSGDVEVQEATTTEQEPAKEVQDSDFIPEEQMTDKVKKRVDTLTARGKEAERKAEAQARENAELKARLDAIDKAKEDELLSKTPPAPPVVDEYMDPAEFEQKNAEYLRERDAFITEQAKVTARQEARIEQEQAEKARETLQVLEEYQTKTVAFIEQAPDFQATVQAQLSGLNESVALELMKMGPEASYFVAKNPEIRNELHFAQDDFTRGRLIAQVQAKIAAGPEPRTITSAGSTVEGLDTAGAALESDPIAKLGGRIE